VSVSEVVGVEVLPPILAALRERHPLLVVELVLSNQVDDLLRREADIAVRMLAPRQDALVAKRVGAIELGLHAHERYLAAHGKPRSLAALAGHALIGYDNENAFIRKWQERYPAFARNALAFRADSDLAQLAAIRAGLGIGVCQAALAAREPAAASAAGTDPQSEPRNSRRSLRCVVVSASKFRREALPSPSCQRMASRMERARPSCR